MRGFEAEMFEMVTNQMSSHYSVHISFRVWDSGGEFEAVCVISSEEITSL